MTNVAPRVSVGLPVYNGERYLAHALDSILAQTFGDFELIISDNGSTDATEELCRMYASGDRRIQYYRNDRNMGVAWNFNRVFELSTGEYFRWASHDDVCAPALLARCVEALDARPDVILVHPRMAIIDEHGSVMERYAVTLRTDSARPHERFYELIRTTHRCIQMFGLIRTNTLKMTPLVGNYTSSDVPLLARLGLLGRFHEIPEYLLSYRHHPRQSMQLNRLKRTVWFEPGNVGRIVFPEWKLYGELLKCVTDVPLPWSERVWCALYVLCWPAWQRHWRRMGKEVMIASQQILGLSISSPDSDMAIQEQGKAEMEHSRYRA